MLLHSYIVWQDYQRKFGYMSMSALDNNIGAALYIKKYVTKTFENSPISMGLHTYYRSKGLNTAIKTWLEHQALYDEFWKMLYSDEFCDLFDIDKVSAERMIKEYEMVIPKKEC